MKIKKVLIIVLLVFNTGVFASTHILFLGDSLSEGLGVDEEQSFPRIVERNLKAKKYDVVVTNGGVSGSTTASGLNRMNWHLKKPTDILVLELGANDGLRGIKLTETEKNLFSIIKKAKDKKIKVLLLGLLMPPNYGKVYTTQFEEMYKKIAAKEKVPFLPFILKDVAGRVDLNQADGIHPNVKGNEIIAKLVSEFVEKNL
jgi:acyl-CoA thioesterase-1